MRKSHFSSSGVVNTLIYPHSFTCACTAEGPKWCSQIRYDNESPRPQCHPNWSARKYLGHWGTRVMVLVEARISL